MAVKKRVLVYGRSLSLAGVSACLQLDKTLDVLFLDPNDPDAQGYFEEFNPETILFDLSNPPNELDLALLRNRPGVLLVGVDPSSDEVLVLSGQRSRVVTAGELTQLVAGQSGRPTATKKHLAEE